MVEILIGGSQISDGVYASARDVGNLFAGMYGSSLIFGKYILLKAFGAYNANDNKGIWNIDFFVNLCLKNFTVPYGEKFESHYMQKLGYEMGIAKRNKRKINLHIPSH